MAVQVRVLVNGGVSAAAIGKVGGKAKYKLLTPPGDPLRNANVTREEYEEWCERVGMLKQACFLCECSIEELRGMGFRAQMLRKEYPSVEDYEHKRREAEDKMRKEGKEIRHVRLSPFPLFSEIRPAVHSHVVKEAEAMALDDDPAFAKAMREAEVELRIQPIKK